MKKILLFLLIIAFLASCEATENETRKAAKEEIVQQSAATAQEIPFIPVDPNRASLEFLSGLEGKYPFNNQLFTTEPMKKRLQNLMAYKYEDFLKRMEVQVPIKIEGDLAIMQGLMKHSGGDDEAIVVVDIPKNLIWVAILENGENVFHFNEDGNLQMPIPLFQVIMGWRS